MEHKKNATKIKVMCSKENFREHNLLLGNWRHYSITANVLLHKQYQRQKHDKLTKVALKSSRFFNA